MHLYAHLSFIHSTAVADTPPCVPLSPSPSNGQLSTCGSVFASGSTCSISCNSGLCCLCAVLDLCVGYFLSGAPYQCNAGVISGSQSCSPQPCSLSTAPSHGGLGTCVSVASGSSCSITCSSGYSVSGANYQCNLGTLSGSQTCSRIRLVDLFSFIIGSQPILALQWCQLRAAATWARART